jgi:hypothetical protein
MPMEFSARPASLTDRLAQTFGASGFALASAEEIRSRIGNRAGAASWKVFAESWDELAPDAYMQDGGHYRLRTFGAYGAGPSGIFAKGRQPHFQSRTFNGLNGGIDRWFAPIAGTVARGWILMAVMTMAQEVFERCSDRRAWDVEVHQFRIQASELQSGSPTPEGMHRDGVDFGLVMMIGTENVSGGKTTLEDADGHAQCEFTLRGAGECLLFDDSRVRHGVSAISQIVPNRRAIRDVLVITFKAAACEGHVVNSSEQIAIAQKAFT